MFSLMAERTSGAMSAHIRSKFGLVEGESVNKC